MQKNKLIDKLLLTLILFFISAGISYAAPAPLFNLKTEVLRQNIDPSQNAITVPLLPFSNLIIKPGTFNETVTLHVFTGDFNQIKNTIKGQSPTASYLFLFNTKNGTVFPAVPLEIQSYNNFNNTNTYFYPVSSPFNIDSANGKNWNGNIKADVQLPLNDSGFIVAANINLNANDKALNPLSPTVSVQNNVGQQVMPGTASKKISVWEIIGILLILGLISVFIGVFVFRGRKRKI